MYADFFGYFKHFEGNFDSQCHFCLINQHFPPENHLKIGFFIEELDKQTIELTKCQ